MELISGSWSKLLIVSLFCCCYFSLFIFGCAGSSLLRGPSPVAARGGPPLAVARGPLIAVASPVVEHRLQVSGLQQLWHVGSVVVAHGL